MITIRHSGDAIFGCRSDSADSDYGTALKRLLAKHSLPSVCMLMTIHQCSRFNEFMKLFKMPGFA